MFTNKDAFNIALGFTEKKKNHHDYLKELMKNYEIFNSSINSEDPLATLKKKPFVIPDEAFFSQNN